jgi:hypothetical protein
VRNTATESLDTFESRLASFDPGRTIEALQRRLEAEQRRFVVLEVDFQNAQADVVAKNREIGRLKAELTKREQSSTTMQEVRDVWDHYVAKVAKRKDVTLGDNRKKMIRDRLRELREAGCDGPAAKLKLAIDGLAARPYVRAAGGRTGEAKGAKRYADLKYALGSDERVETAIAWLEVEQPKSNVVPLRRRGPDPFDEPVQRVLEALRREDCSYRIAAGSDGRALFGRWMAQCPAHDDRSPSLSIREEEDRVLLHCFAGCEVVDVCNALGLSLSALFARSAS